MAYNKSELFSTELQTCSTLFKALGHPARLAILEYLAETKTCITGDLAYELPLGRTTVNQHLKELKDADLIVVLQNGEIVERGTHDELVAFNGIYSDLHQKQLLEQELETM